jgi:hypothetical protein
MHGRTDRQISRWFHNLSFIFQNMRSSLRKTKARLHAAMYSLNVEEAKNGCEVVTEMIVEVMVYWDISDIRGISSQRRGLWKPVPVYCKLVYTSGVQSNCKTWRQSENLSIWEKNSIFFFKFVRWDFGYCDHYWPIVYQPRMIVDGDCGEIGGMEICKGNRNTRIKPAPAPFCPP